MLCPGCQRSPALCRKGASGLGNSVRAEAAGLLGQEGTGATSRGSHTVREAQRDLR